MDSTHPDPNPNPNTSLAQAIAAWHAGRKSKQQQQQQQQHLVSKEQAGAGDTTVGGTCETDEQSRSPTQAFTRSGPVWSP